MGGQPLHLTLMRKRKLGMKLVPTNDSANPKDRHAIGGKNSVPFSNLKNELDKLRAVTTYRRMVIGVLLFKHRLQFIPRLLFRLQPRNVTEFFPADRYAT